MEDFISTGVSHFDVTCKQHKDGSFGVDHLAKVGTRRKSARSRGTYRAGAIRATGNIVLNSNITDIA